MPSIFVTHPIKMKIIAFASTLHHVSLPKCNPHVLFPSMFHSFWHLIFEVFSHSCLVGWLCVRHTSPRFDNITIFGNFMSTNGMKYSVPLHRHGAAFVFSSKSRVSCPEIGLLNGSLVDSHTCWSQNEGTELHSGLPRGERGLAHEGLKLSCLERRLSLRVKEYIRCRGITHLDHQLLSSHLHPLIQHQTSR